MTEGHCQAIMVPQPGTQPTCCGTKDKVQGQFKNLLATAVQASVLEYYRTNKTSISFKWCKDQAKVSELAIPAASINSPPCGFDPGARGCFGGPCYQPISEKMLAVAELVNALDGKAETTLKYKVTICVTSQYLQVRILPASISTNSTIGLWAL